MNRINKMLLLCTAVLTAAFLAGSARHQVTAAASAEGGKTSENEIRIYSVKTALKEQFSVDPEKRIGVYGRYTELTAEDGAPDALLRIIAEVNARAKETVEAEAERFLAENRYRKRKAGSGAEDHFRYHNVSCIVNVTRADSVLFSILEAEMISGIGEKEGDWLSEAENCRFRASVYDTQSGMPLTPADFLTDPGSLPERLEAALENKYALEGLYTDGRKTTPAWTADYLGLRFYFDAAMIPEEKKNRQGMDSRKAVHVSIPYTALDGPEALAAAGAPVDWLLSAALADGGAHLTLRLCESGEAALEAESAEARSEADAAALRELERRLSFVYPHARAEALPSKVTATGLKGHREADEEAAVLEPKRHRPFRMPDFARKDKPATGAEKGTATHLVLQYMDFAKTDSPEAVQGEINRLRAQRFLSEREAAAVDAGAIVRLFASPLGQRMKNAPSLRREFKFSLLCDAAELYGEAPGEELLLQGVVDCYLEEPEGLIVIDYKTDRLKNRAEAQKRAEVYRGQLAAYASALERITGRPVRECVLYFLSVGEAVSLGKKA